MLRQETLRSPYRDRQSPIRGPGENRVVFAIKLHVPPVMRQLLMRHYRLARNESTVKHHHLPGQLAADHLLTETLHPTVQPVLPAQFHRLSQYDVSGRLVQEHGKSLHYPDNANPAFLPYVALKYPYQNRLDHLSSKPVSQTSKASICKPLLFANSTKLGKEVATLAQSLI